MAEENPPVADPADASSAVSAHFAAEASLAAAHVAHFRAKDEALAALKAGGHTADNPLAIPGRLAWHALGEIRAVSLPG